MTQQRQGAIVAAGLCALLFLSPFGATLRAQSPSSSENEEKGLTFYEQFQGSSNSLGQIMKLDTSVGWDFNRYFGVDAGVPFYFIRASTTAASTGAQSGNGIGNVYADLRLTLLNPLVNYSSTLTGTAPTGDKALGLSTGRATFDWNNHFDHRFGSIRPFVSAGIANSVSDTLLYTRPFTTLGFVSHFEGGARLRIVRGVHLGASLYDILPSGQQKVFSRLRGRGSIMPGATLRHRGGVFENAFETVGGADIAKDNGFSAWLDASPMRYLNLEAGYTRSVPYDLNTVSFGVGLNLGSVIRLARGR